MSWFLVLQQRASGQHKVVTAALTLNANQRLALYRHYTVLPSQGQVGETWSLHNTLWRRLLAHKAHLWTLELLLKFGVNNNFVIFQTPVVPNLAVYKNHLMDVQAAKKFNLATHSHMVFGFTTGRCGFVRNQKRTFLATEVTMRTALWFCKRIYKFLGAVKIGLRGFSRNVPRYFKTFRRFELGQRQVAIHSLVDVTPVPYNGTRAKARGRKRYRYHKYTYRRLAKMLKVRQPRNAAWTVRESVATTAGRSY
jgi:ribosomal protein S11